MLSYFKHPSKPIARLFPFLILAHANSSVGLHVTCYSNESDVSRRVSWTMFRRRRRTVLRQRVRSRMLRRREQTMLGD